MMLKKDIKKERDRHMNELFREDNVNLNNEIAVSHVQTIRALNWVLKPKKKKVKENKEEKLEKFGIGDPLKKKDDIQQDNNKGNSQAKKE